MIKIIGTAHIRANRIILCRRYDVNPFFSFRFDVFPFWSRFAITSMREMSQIIRECISFVGYWMTTNKQTKKQQQQGSLLSLQFYFAIFLLFSFAVRARDVFHFSVSFLLDKSFLFTFHELHFILRLTKKNMREKHIK